MTPAATAVHPARLDPAEGTRDPTPEYYAELKDKDGRHLGERFFAVAENAAESHATGLLTKAHGRDARIVRIEGYGRSLTNQRAQRVYEITC